MLLLFSVCVSVCVAGCVNVHDLVLVLSFLFDLSVSACVLIFFIAALVRNNLYTYYSFVGAVLKSTNTKCRRLWICDSHVRAS